MQQHPSVQRLICLFVCMNQIEKHLNSAIKSKLNGNKKKFIQILNQANKESEEKID